MENKYVWTGLAIVAMWLAVLFPGVYGPTFETTSAGGDVVSIPTAWAIAPFAMVATIVVGIFGFRK